ncbi:helicase-related protein, partial [Methanocaldococcus infernus]
MEKEDPDEFTRHRVRVVDGNVFDIIQNLELNKNFFIFGEIKLEKPVLIVCNTVDRAIEVYKYLKNKKFKVLLIHGRFTYGDRERLEKEVRENIEHYDFIVSTQVIEVSLDISFNSILSEPAPLDA